MKFDSINYWLEQWFLFYSKVLKEYEEKKHVIFISYEKLNSKIMWKGIFKKLDTILPLKLSSFLKSKIKLSVKLVPTPDSSPLKFLSPFFLNWKIVLLFL